MPLPSKKQVYIRSRRPHHPALRFNNSGRVCADQFENGTQCWTLVHLGNDMYQERKIAALVFTGQS